MESYLDSGVPVTSYDLGSAVAAAAASAAHVADARVMKEAAELELLINKTAESVALSEAGDNWRRRILAERILASVHAARYSFLEEESPHHAYYLERREHYRALRRATEAAAPVRGGRWARLAAVR